ncbi:MAG: hypothetical protein GC192_23540 [Bacteroidetes bacterium]|nr:hypothetical protein [Bacteroidota bacterium]
MAQTKQYTIADDETIITWVTKTSNVPELIEAIQDNFPADWMEEIESENPNYDDSQPASDSNAPTIITRKYSLDAAGAEQFAKAKLADIAVSLVMAFRRKKAEAAAKAAAEAASTPMIIKTDIVSEV